MGGSGSDSAIRNGRNLFLGAILGHIRSSKWSEPICFGNCNGRKSTPLTLMMIPQWTGLKGDIHFSRDYPILMMLSLTNSDCERDISNELQFKCEILFHFGNDVIADDNGHPSASHRNSSEFH